MLEDNERCHGQCLNINYLCGCILCGLFSFFFKTVIPVQKTINFSHALSITDRLSSNTKIIVFLCTLLLFLN